MKTPDELPGLYERWRELTVAEGGAIRAERWPAVSDLQRQKTDLQAAIERAVPRPPGGDLALPALIRELMELEAENARLLDLKLADRQRERTELDRSDHNLRRLRGSYGQVRAGNWHSYS